MPERKDLSGKKFGRLTVIKYHSSINHKAAWLCKCECGNEKIVKSPELLRGKTKSCGCFSKEVIASRSLELVGKKFGKLTVIKKSKTVGKKVYWECLCECGNTTYKMGGQLVADKSHSCGCFQKERVSTHKMSRTRFYGIWRKAKTRCNVPSAPDYKNYGGRGITFCSEWLDFNNFYNDMYESYIRHIEEYGKKDTSIDRINNDKGYSKENCRWATMKEQANNKRPRRYKNELQETS